MCSGAVREMESLASSSSAARGPDPTLGCFFVRAQHQMVVLAELCRLSGKVLRDKQESCLRLRLTSVTHGKRLERQVEVACPIVELLLDLCHLRLWDERGRR